MKEKTKEKVYFKAKELFILIAVMSLMVSLGLMSYYSNIPRHDLIWICNFFGFVAGGVCSNINFIEVRKR